MKEEILIFDERQWKIPAQVHGCFLGSSRLRWKYDNKTAEAREHKVKNTAQTRKE
jgi:hypothetical protein